MTEEDIERIAREDPDTIPESAFFEGRVILPPKKESVHIRLDADMLAWFRANGSPYQTYINSVLRKWYEMKSRQSTDRSIL